MISATTEISKWKANNIHRSRSDTFLDTKGRKYNNIRSTQKARQQRECCSQLLGMVECSRWGVIITSPPGEDIKKSSQIQGRA